MSSTPFNKRAWNLGLKVVPNFEALSDEVIAYYEKHLDQIPEALARGFMIPKPIEPKIGPLTFEVVAAFPLGAVEGKKTYQCFTGKLWGYRDANIDSWLVEDQPGSEACMTATCTFSREWVFIEAVHILPGAPQTNDVVELGNWLIQNGYTLKPQQVEDMVEATTERGENTGLRIDGYGNFFFVETCNPKSPVSVGIVYRDGRVWNAYVNSLGYSFRWYADLRLLLRNLDTSNLGS